MTAHHLRSRSALAALIAALTLVPACVVGDEDGSTDDPGESEVDDGLPDLEGPDEWTPEAFATAGDDVGISCSYDDDCYVYSYAIGSSGPRVCHQGSCRLKQATFHPGACTAHACWPDHWPTAEQRCFEEGFARAVGQQSWQVAGDKIWVGGWMRGEVQGVPAYYYWHQVQIGGGRAMQRVTCERNGVGTKPVYVPPPPPPPPPPAPPAPPVPPSGTTVSFKTHLWPRLKSNCGSCHGGLGSLSTTAFSLMTSGSFGSCNGKNGIIPKNAWGSPLYQKVRGTPKCGGSMAGYSNSTLRNILYRWINQGARNN